MSRQLVLRILLAIAGSAALHVLVVGVVTIPHPAAVATAAQADALEVRLASDVDHPAAVRKAPAAVQAPDPLQVPLPGVVLPAPPPRETEIHVDPRQYYPALELDERAQPVADIDLTAPETKGAEYAGTVRLELRIDRDGVVEKVTVLDASVPQSFQDSAVAAFRAARFTPARKNGEAVNSRKVIEVNYGPTVK